MAGNIGRALNIAIPRSIESISAIQGLQERAEKMRMEEELQPYRMQNLQAQTALNQMTVQQRAYELNKQKELINLQRQPRTVDDLLSFARGFAPKTTEKWKQSLIAGGAVDDYGVSTAEKFMLWGDANPLEFQSLAFEGVNEIEQSITEKQRLITGYTDEKGKFIPPDKNAPILQNQIQQLRNSQQWLIGTMGSEFQQKLELEKVKQADIQETPFGQIDPSKYTPESIRKFQQSGNYGDLEVRPEIKEGKEFVLPTTIEFFVKKGIAKDYKEAYQLYKSATTKTREGFIQDLITAITKGAMGEFGEEQIKTLGEAIKWRDKLIGTEGREGGNRTLKYNSETGEFEEVE